MTNSLDHEIQQQLGWYLRGEISLADFEAWLVPATWDVSPQSDPAAHGLATAITLRIAEFTNGDWSEDELRRELDQLQPKITLSGGEKGQVIILASQGQGSSQVAGKQPAGASA
jgi:hypothetical protein